MSVPSRKSQLYLNNVVVVAGLHFIRRIYVTYVTYK